MEVDCLLLVAVLVQLVSGQNNTHLRELSSTQRLNVVNISLVVITAVIDPKSHALLCCLFVGGDTVVSASRCAVWC